MPVDRVVWTKYPANPVFTKTGPAWEAGGVACPSVVKIATGYRMYYQGDDGAGNIKIGVTTCPLASFPTGPWIPYAGNPVLTVGAGAAWDSNWVSNPKVWVEAGVYYMFYEGDNGINTAIGYATSADGLVWAKHAGNPVLERSAIPWESQGVGTPQVVKRGSLYHLYYHGAQNMGGGYFKDQIGLAYSVDLNTWTREASNPLVTVGPAGTWDDYKVGAKCFAFMSHGYNMMIYEGFDGTVPPGSRFWQLGLASSPTMISWSKHPDNPVLANGPVGSWDWGRCSNLDLFYEDGIYYLFYTGGGPGGCKIGVATGSIPYTGPAASHTVDTLSVTSLTDTRARLNGMVVESLGDVVSVGFEYGASISYGNKTPLAAGFVTGGTFYANISGLAEGILYHVRAFMVTPSRAIVYGPDRAFVTDSCRGPVTWISDTMAQQLEGVA